ncbi:MAG: MBL fold metallo-hydrolase [Patescibacteria group bacterium]
MLSIKTLPVGDLTANCYLVSNGNKCIIIDPGDDADFITETIANEKLTPIAIVLTHGHFDHVLGCLELKLNFDVPILLHKNDLKLYSSANQSALHWLKKKTLKVPPVDQFIKEGDKIKVGGEVLTVIETPGHTPGSICLYDGTKNLFSGDTIFKDGVGRTDFSYSSPLQLTKSLDKLSKLPKETIVYPGHGESFISSYG